MDPASALKNHFFRPIATILAPRGLASAPFLLIVVNWFAVDPLSIIDKRPVPAAILIFVVSLMAGFVLENIGGLYEHYALDQVLLRKKFPALKAAWDAYLCMRICLDVFPRTAQGQ